MLIELHGAQFMNKGAELMLRTAIDRLESYGHRHFVVDPVIGTYAERSALGLKQIFPMRFWMGNRKFRPMLAVQKWWPRAPFRRIREHYGCVTIAEVDALVDMAGFAYTDQWGTRPIADFAALTAYYRKRGRPIILLPQAFGPFSRTGEHFQRIIDNATLVFARDKQSFEFAKDVTGASENLRLAPDITLFGTSTQCFVTPDGDLKQAYCCIVPNARMLDQGSKEWRSKYVGMLTRAARELLRAELSVKIVVHDTSGRDFEIANAIRGRVSTQGLKITQMRDPLSLRSLLGRSYFIIGSRFHALVAAFSQAVPSIGIGWAHKYDALYGDFGCNRFLVGASESEASFFEKLGILLDNEQNNHVRERISSKLDAMHRANVAMWDAVSAVLKVR